MADASLAAAAIGSFLTTGLLRASLPPFREAADEVIPASPREAGRMSGAEEEEEDNEEEEVVAVVEVSFEGEEELSNSKTGANEPQMLFDLSATAASSAAAAGAVRAAAGAASAPPPAFPFPFPPDGNDDGEIQANGGGGELRDVEAEEKTGAGGEDEEATEAGAAAPLRPGSQSRAETITFFGGAAAAPAPPPLFAADAFPSTSTSRSSGYPAHDRFPPCTRSTDAPSHRRCTRVFTSRPESPSPSETLTLETSALERSAGPGPTRTGPTTTRSLPRRETSLPGYIPRTAPRETSRPVAAEIAASA